MKSRRSEESSYQCMAAGWHKAVPLVRTWKTMHPCSASFEIHKPKEDSAPILRVTAVRKHKGVRQRIVISIHDHETLRALARLAAEAVAQLGQRGDA
jgi:hypothetical protein